VLIHEDVHKGLLQVILVLLEFKVLKSRLKRDEGESNMKAQIYSLKAGNISWEPDGFIVLDKGALTLKGVTNERSKRRLNVFLKEHQDNPDKEAFLRSLISVVYVPFCRFGDIIDETTATKEKEENDEVEGISDTDDTEETE